METTEIFYNDLADQYHLLFEDWSRSIERQAAILGPLIARYTRQNPARVLDCACGIGTQTLGLAQLGHRVVASDRSRAAVARAQREARLRKVEVQFHVADMRDLQPVAAHGFDVVLAADNALPHLLLQQDRDRALQQIYGKLGPGGILLATLRDYDRLVEQRPTVQPPCFFGEHGNRRIVHQVWDWDGPEYDLHLHLAYQTSSGWTAKHYLSRYRALRRTELEASLRAAGFDASEWLEPEATGFYQPIVVARR
jgi:glycine/sarcosine N-methyltransferase